MLLFLLIMVLLGCAVCAFWRLRMSKQVAPQQPRPAYPSLPLGGQTPIFHGIRVVELATVIAGPVASTLLAAYGAEVVKVEALDGDPFRKVFLPYEKSGGRKMGTMFESVNFNKRSVRIDLKQSHDLLWFWELLQSADVFITNVRLDGLVRLGLDYKSVSAKLPCLIYANLNAWGLQGPDMALPGYDVGAFWASSSLSATLMPVGRHMLYPGGFGDVQAGEEAFTSICVLLLQRLNGGRGALVDTSLLRLGLWCSSPWLVDEQPGEVCSQSTWDDSLPDYQPSVPATLQQASYRTKDDVYITLLVSSNEEWEALFSLLGVTSSQRVLSTQLLITILQQKFETWSWSEISAQLIDMRVNHTRVMKPDDLIAGMLSKEMANEEIFKKIPGVDDTRGFMNIPFQCHSSSSHGYTKGAPLAGAHTAAYRQGGWSPRPPQNALPAVTKHTSTLPLHGVTVVELNVAPSQCVSVTCFRLAALGATVHKVECEGGDPDRRLRPRLFAQFNRGKLSHEFNWQIHCDRLRTLIAQADLFVTNAPQSSLRAAGVNCEEFQNKPLVYALLTSWGRKGPEGTGERGGFLSSSGIGHYLGGVERPPVVLPEHCGDVMVAFSLLAACLAGLVHLRRTKEGQLVETSELRHGVFCMGPMYACFTKDANKLRMFMCPGELMLNHPIPTYNAFRTKDGVWMQLLGLEVGRHLPRLLKAYGVRWRALTVVVRAAVCEFLPNTKEKSVMVRAIPIFRKINGVVARCFGSLTWQEARKFCDENNIWYSKVATSSIAVRNRQAHASGAFSVGDNQIFVNPPSSFSF